MSSAAAFLTPVKASRKNLVIKTKAIVSAVVFEGKRAVGVRYVHGGQGGTSHVIGARREVVLSAGTVNTAKILQLSGVGPAAHLQQLGIPVVHNAAGVGQNLRDHYAIRMVARAKNTDTINNRVTGIPLLWEILRWLAKKPSLLAVSPSLASAFWMSEEGMQRPDVQFTFTPASFREGVVGLLDKYPGMTCGVWQCRPESLGHVNIVSKDVFDRPKIQPNYLASEVDQRALIGGIRWARKFMTAAPLQQYYQREISPGADKISDAELLQFAREMGTTVYHLIGTARMGPESDPLAVVDANLKPYGLSGLRIVDASIMPTMPSANTNATTMMIAEKGVALILADAANK
jgi:choline dehydrogenase